MKIGNLLLSSCLLTVVSVNAVRKVTIVNNTPESLRVDFTIPEQTEAQIKIKKFSHAQPVNVTSQELLYKAIASDSVADIKKAIQLGADVNYTKGCKPPLMLAVQLKKEVAIQCLLDNGAEVNKRIIEYALELNLTRTAFLLIKKSGLDINAVYSYRTLLDCVSQNRPVDPEFIKLLIKNGISAKDVMQKIFVWCCDADTRAQKTVWLEIIQELINRGYSVNDIWRDGLQRMFSEGNIGFGEEVFKLFIKNGANPNHVFEFEHCGGMPLRSLVTPLSLAILYRSKVTIKMLIDAGADINQKVDIHVYTAYTNCNNNPPKGKAIQKSLLKFAIDYGDAEIIELLIERGASLE